MHTAIASRGPGVVPRGVSARGLAVGDRATLRGLAVTVKYVGMTTW